MEGGTERRLDAALRLLLLLGGRREEDVEIVSLGVSKRKRDGGREGGRA